MLLDQKKSALIEKTEELCQTILEQPLYQKLKEKIGAFMQDEKLKPLYQNLCDQQDRLQAKQQRGEEISDEDIEAFEKDRDLFFDNDLAKDFMDAQKQMNAVLDTVNRYVSKTIELGRLPKEEDLQSGCCGGGSGGGGGCGCK